MCAVETSPAAAEGSPAGVPLAHRGALRWVLRGSLPRPAAARRAAAGLRHRLYVSVGAEVRWAFAPPRAWLSGVAVNLVLSVVWLAVQPVRGEGHRDWVVLVGTYFSSFILADVTTTNVLGIDNVRVGTALADGVSLWRLLLIKNVALLIIVGAPTLAAALALTLWHESGYRLAVTIPNVAVPIFSWLGVGNLISVMLPVAYAPLVRRWRQRRDAIKTLRWLVHLVLPYGLFYLADPIYGAPHRLIWHDVPSALGDALGPETRSLIHISAAMGVWVAGIAGAELLYRWRGLRIS